MNIVKATNLNKIYKTTYALQDFSITINEGDIYGLIGANGAGKSTLIKIIAGLTEQQSGELSLFGESKKLDTQRRRIGSVIENPAFFSKLSARENLEYYATVMEIKDKELIRNLLIKVNLDPDSKKKFGHFSLGMKQRLGIAFALMNSPDFVILDEPTNGLDPKGILELRDIICDLNKQGVTFLICSHILSELSQIATKYGIVHKGKFVKELTNEELVSLHQDKLNIVVEDEYRDALENMLTKHDYVYNNTGDHYEIMLFDGINPFISRLTQNGIRITHISQTTASLEEVFFQTIGGEEEK